MGLPLTTSTYTLIRQVDTEQDGGDPIAFETVQTGIPGVTMFYSGSESVAHGQRERVDVRIALETTVAPAYYDKITDERTGDTWDVSWVRQRIGLGLDHYLCGCLEVTGTARGTRDL